MRHLRFLMVALFVVAPTTAGASPIKYTFDGVFRSILDPGSPFGFRPLDPIFFTGYFIMDSDVPDLDPSPTSGSYAAVGPTYGISVSTSTETFDSFGALGIRVSFGGFAPGATLDVIGTGIALHYSQFACRPGECTDTLMGGLSLGAYDFNRIRLGPYRGDVVSLRHVPMPEPGTWLLVGTGLAVIFRRALVSRSGF